MLIFAVATLALASCVIATPHRRGECNLSGAKIDLPPNQTALAVPTTPPRLIGLGVGMQNYTCNAATSKWASAGAVASLFDVSCIASRKGFALADVSSTAYNIWKVADPKMTSPALLSGFSMPKLGQHYFITNPTTGSGISPNWDFVASKGPDAFVVGSKVAGMPASTGQSDVDWLQLKGIQGGLADAIYRVDTRGGVAPASCTPGTDVAVLSVKYTAIYWFFGGTAPLVCN